MSKGRFHITVIDNEENQELVNADAEVIIGAYQDGKGTGQLCYAAAHTLDIAACYTGVIGVLKLLEQNNPAIGILSELGVMDMVADGNLEEANKDWKQMQVRYPHIEVDE